MLLRMRLLLLLVTLLLAAPASANPAPAVSLLPEGEVRLDEWVHPMALGSPTEPIVLVTLLLPQPAVLLVEHPAVDDMGMVWHLQVAEPDIWGEIRFVQSPGGTDLDPFTFFLATTLFPEDAIALAQTDDLLEVEAPVRIGARAYRGCFRAERRGPVVAVAALALPEPVSADLRATAWASLRLMLAPTTPGSEH